MRRRRFRKANDGDIRLWIIVNPPADPVFYPCNDVEHAKRLRKELAASQLLDKNIETNVFGIEIFEDGEWLDYEEYIEP